MKFLLPTGIGDSVWALHKIEAIRDKQAPGEPIHVSLVGSDDKKDSRALDFVTRFSFVNFADMKPHSIHNGTLFKPDGTYNYIEDGWYEFDGERYCVLIPNATLERGQRLETWLPHYPIRWDIWKDFHLVGKEVLFAHNLWDQIGRYVVFYPGPLHGNTIDGHNRGAIWKPQHWVELGEQITREFGLKIILVGADYDKSYYDMLLGPVLNSRGWLESGWTNLIGQTNLGQLWSVTAMSEFVISYQAGVGIVSTYLGTPTAIFWRAHGDSINPHQLLTFNENMASAWVPPAILEQGKHLPLIYGRHGVDYIVSEIRRRGWHEKGSSQKDVLGMRDILSA